MSNGVYGEDLAKVGVTRKSQSTNVLLVHSELGKVKPRVFSKEPPANFAFGVSKAKDREGAKDVTMKWVEHKPNPNSVPGPDFKAMNKLAAVNEVVTAQEAAAFRTENHITLRAGEHGRVNKVPSLPSHHNPDHVYGRSSADPTIEETRYTGDAVDIKTIVQGGFVDEWVTMNEKRASQLMAKHEWREPKMTKAASGHATIQAKYAETSSPKVFKMKKFDKVQPKLSKTGL